MKKMCGLLIILVALLVSGCACNFNFLDDSKEVKRTSIFSSYIIGYLDKEATKQVRVDPFGSYISFVGYKENRVKALEDMLVEEVTKYHTLLDRNYYYRDKNGNIINNLKVINDSFGSGVSISVDPLIIEILSEGIKYSKLSNGNFNIVSGSIVDIWDNSINISHQDPLVEEINEAMKCVPSISIIDEVLVLDSDNNKVTFNSFDGCSSGSSITLGAIAKSFFLDKLVQIEEFKDVGSSIYDAGQSSIIIKGDNPTRENGKWNIGVNDSLNSNILFQVQAVQLQLDGNVAISTSGGEYKGYINDDGIRRHHIIDAISGYPNTYIIGSTVIGESAMIMDVVSTTLMTMDSLQEAKEYLVMLQNNNINIFVLLQTVENENLKIYVNDSMNNKISQVYNEVDIEVFVYGA